MLWGVVWGCGATLRGCVRGSTRFIRVFAHHETHHSKSILSLSNTPTPLLNSTARYRLLRCAPSRLPGGESYNSDLVSGFSHSSSRARAEVGKESRFVRGWTCCFGPKRPERTRGSRKESCDRPRINAPWHNSVACLPPSQPTSMFPDLHSAGKRQESEHL